jgi:hypothetical protein
MHEPALLLSVAYLTTSALGLWASYWVDPQHMEAMRCDLSAFSSACFR